MSTKDGDSSSQEQKAGQDAAPEVGP
ncbi:MAG: hypothetical protein JWP82_1489, partial [Humibacillus sp.]|nr:hypothetical protein [Humibacillus sp.]